MEMKEPRDSRRRKPNYRGYAILGVGAAVILGLLIAVIVLAVKRSDCTDGSPPKTIESAAPGVLVYYNLTDGLDLRWYRHAQTQADITAATTGQYHIIEADVSFPASSTELVPGVIGGEFLLNGWLDLVQPTSAGIKLNLGTNKAAKETLTLLNTRKFYRPAFLSIPLMSPGVNLRQLLAAIQPTDDNLNIVLSLDLSGGCCGDSVGFGTMEYLYNKVKDVNLNLNIELRPEQVDPSWEEIKWFLNKIDNATVTVSDQLHAPSQWTRYEMVKARNDIDKDKILYNLNGTILDEFLDLASSAGSPLHYFSIHPRDASRIIWSHNTDTWTKLTNAIQGDTMMIEGDIRMRGQGAGNQTDVPIMAHDIGEDNNMTFTEWLDEIIKVDKGMKLDFKSLEAVGPSLAIVNSRRHEIKGPIWANADILKGNGNNVTMTPSIFLNDIKSFPGVTLSLGWTTLGRNGTNATFTLDMVREMHEICKQLPQPVTIPARAEMLRDSWPAFDWLLRQSRGYTLTVWTFQTDTVAREDMEYVKQQAEHSRIYFDLPPELRPRI